MAIRSEILVEDKGTAVIESHARAADRAFDRIGQSADRASNKFDLMAGKAGAASQKFNSAADNMSRAFLTTGQQVELSLAKVELSLGKVPSAANRASERVEASLAQLERSYFTLGGKIDRFASEARLKMESFAASVVSGVSRAVNQFRRLDDSFQRNVATFSRFRTGIGSVMGSIFNLRNAIVGLGIGFLGKQVADAALSMRSLRIALNAAGGSAEEGGRAFQFVAGIGEELGFQIVQLGQSYRGLLASTRAAGKETEFAETVFKNASIAIRGLSLSNDDAAGVFRAFEQVLNKTKFQAEEVTQQMGDRLPGALAILQEAVGLTEAEFFKAMQAGQIGAENLIVFTELLAEKFGGEVRTAAQLLTADMNRLRNEALFAAEQFGEAGFLAGIQDVVKAIRGVVRESRQSGALDDFARALGDLGGEIATLIRDEGKDFIALLTDMSRTIKDNLVPAFKTITTTSSQVFNALGVSLSQMKIAAIDLSNAVLGVRNSFSFVLDLLSNIIPGFGALLTSYRLLNTEAQDQIEKNKELRDEAVRTRDTYQSALNDMAVGQLELSNGIKLTTEEQQRQGQEMTQLQGIVDALGDGFKLVGKDIVAVAKESGDALKNDLAGGTKEAKKELTELEKAYLSLKVESSAQLQAAATEAVKAFERIKDSGQESNTALLRIFKDVSEKVLTAWGEVPPEFQALFSQMESIAGSSFSNIETSGTNAANSISSSMGNALSSIADVSAALNRIDTGGGALDRIEGRGGSGGGGAGSSSQGGQIERPGGQIDVSDGTQGDFSLGGRGGREITQRMEENTRAVDDFANAFAGSTFEYAESLDGLIQQQHELARNFNEAQRIIGAGSSGIPGSLEAYQGRIRALQDEVNLRIADMQAQREADRLAAIVLPADEGAVIDRTQGAPSAAGGGAVDFSGGAGSAGGGAVLVGAGASPASGSTGDDVDARGDNSGLDEVLADDRFAGIGTRRSSGGEQRSVIMENPTFVVQQNGINAEAIDAKGLATALAEPVEEAIRVGDLELDNTSRKITTR